MLLLLHVLLVLSCRLLLSSPCGSACLLLPTCGSSASRLLSTGGVEVWLVCGCCWLGLLLLLLQLLWPLLLLLMLRLLSSVVLSSLSSVVTLRRLMCSAACC